MTLKERSNRNKTLGKLSSRQRKQCSNAHQWKASVVPWKTTQLFLMSLGKWKNMQLCLTLLMQVLILSTKTVVADIEADKQGLVSFMNAVDVAHVLNTSWQGEDPCSLGWSGVQCKKGRVWNLVLESKQLRGIIPVDALSKLDKLRKLSLKNNFLSGKLPVLASPFLRDIWLQNNHFEGPIVYEYSLRFNVLNLANNHLSGPIPISLASLPNLRRLNLEENSLTGGIPAFNQTSLESFNVSHNQLTGEIPNTFVLQHTFGPSSYADNPELCGLPMNRTCKTIFRGKGPLTTKEIVGMVVGDFAVLVLLTLAFFWHYRQRYRKAMAKESKRERQGGKKPQEKKGEQDEDSLKEMSTPSTESPEGTDSEKRKIVIVSSEIGRETAFELEDLLRASAELLGKGGLGTSYKALLEERGLTVVVKRLGRGFRTCNRKEFEQQMQLLGRLNHVNLAPLLAYYFDKDEKLLVNSYMPNSDLFSLLHGKHRQGGDSLDWAARLRIARRIAHGLYYLHRECKAQKLPHGNMKSSNVLFDKNMEVRLVDYGMAPLMESNSTFAIKHIIAYKTPEYLSSKKLSPKADVYGFGVVLLELLTGKQPSYYSNREGVVDLPQYVRSATEEEWTSEVFDRDLGPSLHNASDVEGMISLLRLAMDCVEASPEERPKMKQVYRRIKDVKESSLSSESFPLTTSSDEALQAPAEAMAMAMAMSSSTPTSATPESTSVQVGSTPACSLG